MSVTKKKIGTIRANKTTNDFNQSIPIEIITILFANPVNLSNLHQSWLMKRTRRSVSNIQVATEIILVSNRANFSRVYQAEVNISQSFCIRGQMKRTFDVNETQLNETRDFLCKNLSASDLKAFLIDVQEQLDKQFLVNK